MRIQVNGIVKRYGAFVAVDNISIDIEDGEFVVLLGPSGCGKTTTMRSIVGLETPDAGRISIGDQTVFDATRGVNVAPNHRNMGMVFQSYAIWPHMSVSENVAFPLHRRRMPRSEVGARVTKALDLVGLGAQAEKGASFLSGGQMQRVALARAIVAEPRVLLLDEPLSNLDAKLREQLRFELRDIQQRLRTTTIYVTHDQSEALALADRIIVMQDGRIEQQGSPQDIYMNPRSAFVADFLGFRNIFAAVPETSGQGVSIDDGRIVLRTASPASGGSSVCIRPEHVRIAAPGDGGQVNALPASVRSVSYLGSQIRYLVAVHDRVIMEAVTPAEGPVRQPGEAVAAIIPPADIQLLGARS